VVTAVLNGAGSAEAANGQLLPGMRAAIAVVAGVAAVGALGAAIRLRFLPRPAPQELPVDEPFVPELTRDAA